MHGAARIDAPPGRVRLRRAPLERSPTLAEITAAIAQEAAPFVLAGRWGLPAGADPAERVIVAGAAPRAIVGASSDPFEAFDAVPELEGDAPPGAIGGGLVGWLGYDLGRVVERTLGPQPARPIPLASAHLGWYDDVLRRDAAGTWWVEALVPASEPDGGAAALDAAKARWRARLDAGAALPDAALGAMTPHRGEAAHRAAVAETVRRIHAGELFQANVCLRLEGRIEGPAAGLAPRILAGTDPWFGAWMASESGEGILSASPELFLRRRGGDVVTGPIKGTAPRGTDAAASPTPAAAHRDPAALGLQRSEKDQAEHVMIVDLMRNDLGRVSDYGSIWHEDAPRLEPHAGVWHLVSQVGGRLHDGLGDAKLLRATFPPGSVTGAPKVQAMRVIAAVEGTGREAYTGAHGLASPASGLELAVTIRTVEFAGDRAWIGVGGGIVADSLPEAELGEALGKARALVAAAGGTVEAGAAAPAEPVAAAPAAPAAAQAAPEAGRGPAAQQPIWMRSADRRPDPAAGLLETLIVEDGTPRHLAAHLLRLDRSLAALGLPPVPSTLAEQATELAATAVAPARLRILGRGPRNRTGELDVELQLVPMMATGIGAGPTALAPAVVPGGIGPHKFLDRDLIDALTARLGATPLLLDADATVLEAGWANIWWLDERGLATTPTDGRILPGVTRAVLLARRSRAPVRVREDTIGWNALQALPLLLTSARGVSVARLPSTPPAAVDRATALAAELGALVAAD